MVFLSKTWPRPESVSFFLTLTVHSPLPLTIPLGLFCFLFFLVCFPFPLNLTVPLPFVSSLVLSFLVCFPPSQFGFTGGSFRFRFSFPLFTSLFFLLHETASFYTKHAVSFKCGANKFFPNQSLIYPLFFWVLTM